MLGSLPGEASLAAARYYAHPQNQFWRLIGAAIGRDDLAALAYDERLAALLGAGVGLWDTIASATRRGSLDQAIRDAEPAALPALIATLSDLRAIAFNGAKSAAIGRMALAGSHLTLIDLPSSSPAHAGMPFAEKARRWRVVADFLTPEGLPWPSPPDIGKR